MSAWLPSPSAPRRARVEGFVAHGWEALAGEFERNLAERGEVGAAFCAVADGEVVADLWGGRADARGRPWSGDTLCPIFSGTKGLVATCMLLLVERGLVDLKAPVASYWPEFAAAGKDEVLIRHVVAHQAGLPGLTTEVTLQEAVDGPRMARLLAEQRPLTAAGEVVAYHVLTFGWLCAELIRRVDGRAIGRFFRDEVAEPLELDIWIGLPDREDSRVAVLERAPDFNAELPRYDRGRTTERDRVLWSILDNPRRMTETLIGANTPLWRRAQIPATSGIASARSMARLYGCLACGGQLDGVRLLSPSTVEAGRRCLARGSDPYLGFPLAYGTGFELQTETRDLGPAPDAFGHGGSGGSLHAAWPDLRVGFSYTMNLLSATRIRSSALLESLYAAAKARDVVRER